MMPSSENLERADVAGFDLAEINATDYVLRFHRPLLGELCTYVGLLFILFFEETKFHM